jgi:hypothetical protein
MSVSLRGGRGGGWVRGVALATALAVLPGFGCSFVFLDRPRDYKPSEKVDCTTSYALPTADLALALLHIASIAILASASGNSFGGDKSRQTLAQADIFWMIMNGSSSAWGFYKVGECRDIVAEDQGMRFQPVRVPRPRPRRIESPSESPSTIEPPAPAPAPAQEPSAAPAPAAAPVPQLPRVPQQVDQD